MSNEGMMAFF
jgi:hypothetical protein